MGDVLVKLTVWFDRVAGRRFYRMHRFVYERSGGRIGHRTPAGPMLLLTTRGRRTGMMRTHPLLYMPDGPNYVVVGSNGGRPQSPAWILNLSADSRVEVQVGPKRLRAEARILSEGERAGIWPRLAAHYEGWSYYQGLTERALHVVEVTPVPQVQP